MVDTDLFVALEALNHPIGRREDRVGVLLQKVVLGEGMVLRRHLSAMDVVAAFTHVSGRKPTFLRVYGAGALTSYKVGRSWRVDELDLVDYIERQKARHGAELSAVAVSTVNSNGANAKSGDGNGQRPD